MVLEPWITPSMFFQFLGKVRYFLTPWRTLLCTVGFRIYWYRFLDMYLQFLFLQHYPHVGPFIFIFTTMLAEKVVGRLPTPCSRMVVVAAGENQ